MGTISYHAGLVKLSIGEPLQAFPAFNSFKQHPSGLAIPEHIRLETVNGQSRAAIMINDLERYTALAGEVFTGAIAIRSKKRFDEARTIFRQSVPKTWSRSSKIKEFAEKYQLDRIS